MAAANGTTVHNYVNVYNCWVIDNVPMTYYQAILADRTTNIGH